MSFAFRCKVKSSETRSQQRLQYNNFSGLAAVGDVILCSRPKELKTILRPNAVVYVKTIDDLASLD